MRLGPVRPSNPLTNRYREAGPPLPRKEPTLTAEPLTSREPEPDQEVDLLVAFAPRQEQLDGAQDARETLARYGTRRSLVTALLDHAWEARNAARSVTAARYGYWAGQMDVYREQLKLTPERDLARRIRLAASA